MELLWYLVNKKFLDKTVSEPLLVKIDYLKTTIHWEEKIYIFFKYTYITYWEDSKASVRHKFYPCSKTPLPNGTRISGFKFSQRIIYEANGKT